MKTDELLFVKYTVLLKRSIWRKENKSQLAVRNLDDPDDPAHRQHDEYQIHVYSTYQIFADFDWILEHGPDDGLVAIWGGQGAMVSVVLGEVHPDQKRIQWNSTNIDMIGWRRRKKHVYISFFKNWTQYSLWSMFLLAFGMLDR